MSSKSRKQVSKSGAKSKARPDAGASGAGAKSASGHRGGGVLDIPDQYLHVPKKTSPLKFMLMIGLVIVLLVIFVVPSAIYSWVGRGTQEVEILARWNHPDGDVIELSRPEFEQTSRRYSSIFGSIRRDAISPGQMLGLQLGVLDFDASGINSDLSYEELARLMILERLAKDAGIVITPKDLVAHLTPYIKQYGSIDAYQRATARLGNWGAVAFEDSLRQALAVQRYLVILGESSAMPDPAGIEEAWKRDHVETQYDYVELELASLEEGVRAEVPSDEDLQTWFDGLEDLERNRYQEPERRRVALAVYRDPESTPATGLLEKYPEPEDAVAVDRANDYYDRVFSDRFKLPEEEQTAPTPLEGQDPAPPKIYYSREEVAEQCLREAPIFFALDRWLRDLQTRRAEGAEIDLAAEAADLGLACEVPEEPLSVEELGARADLGGFTVAGRAFGTEAGSFASTQIVEDDFLGLLQVIEVIEPAIPPLADIRDEVVDYWVEKEVAKRAVARLEAIRDGFEEFTPEEDEEDASPFASKEDDGPRRRADAETFAAAVTAAGLEVRHRPWLDKGGRTEDDPDFDLPAHRHIKSVVEFADPEVNEVSPVAIDGPGERAYLVRKAGSREVPIDRMSPADYTRYSEQTVRQAPSAFNKRFDTTYLRKEFGLWLFTDDQPAGEGEGAAAAGEGEDANAPENTPADGSEAGTGDDAGNG